MKRGLSVVLPLALAGFCARSVLAQAHEPKPEAVAALKKVVDAYRARPALTIKSTVTVELEQDGAKAGGSEVKLEGTYGKGRNAVVKIRDFTCYLRASGKPETDGTFTVVNDQTPHSYLSVSDDGSPYYALFNAFLDIPYPELAIQLGEDTVENLVMQLHPKAPWLQPTGVRTEKLEGRELRHIRLTSDYDDMDIIVDASTNLIQRIDLTIMGGDYVQSGAKLQYHHVYEYQEHDAPLPDSTFVFDPGTRQRVDTMTALMPPRQVPDEEGGLPEGAENGLIGKPAPTFVLSTLDGKAVDFEDLRGKVVVLDFWATWCGPCRAALPSLHEVEAWRRKENLDVAIYAVNVWEVRDKAADSPDARKKQASEFWTGQKFTLPVIMDYSDQAAKDYGVQGIPTTVIIGPDGIVRQVHVGMADAETLKADIQEAMRPSSSAPPDEKPDEEPEHDHDH